MVGLVADGAMILRWYQEEFRRYLSMPNARLMVIGYGFLDPHINDLIVEGARAGGLRMFIVNPAGRVILRRVNPTSTRSAYGSRSPRSGDPEDS